MLPTSAPKLDAVLKIGDPTRLICPPLSVTVPSSNVSPPTVCVPLTVTVYAPVAVVPAAKTAVSPGDAAFDHAPVTDVPAELVLQKESVPHVPPVLVVPAVV